MGITENWSVWQVLNQLFGFDSGNTSASAALSGTTSDAAFRELIYYFNGGILMAVIAIYTFILIIGTINTAKDGTFLGKNWSSYWIPLRVIIGSSLAIPLKSGFCMAQYLVFLMVGVSINFANHVWQNTYEHLDQNKTPPVMSFDISEGVKKDLALYLLSGFSSDMLAKIGKSAGNNKYYADNKPIVNQMSLVQTAMSIESNAKTAVDSKITGKLKKGIQQWSEFQGNSYWQYYVYEIIHHYTFKLPFKNPDQSAISNALGTYCYVTPSSINVPCSNMITSIQNIHNNSTSISTELQSNPYVILQLSKAIYQGFQDKLKNEAQRATAVKSDTSGDWWNADQKYLTLDGNFDSILKTFHANFSVFDSLLSHGTKDEIDISKIKVTLNYLRNNHSFNNLDKHYSDGSISYLLNPGANQGSQQTQTLSVPLSESENTDTDKFISLDITQLKQEIVDVFNTQNTNCKTLFKTLFSRDVVDSGFNCTDLVNALVPSSVSADIGKYFLVIQTALSNSQAKQENTLVYVSQFLFLIRLFQLNNIAFFHEGALVSDIASPTEQFLNTILQKMDLDRGDHATGVLTQIYNIGESVTPGVAMTNAFSVLRQIQGVGQSLIKVTIDTLQDVANKTNNTFKQVIKEVAITQGVAKGTALVAAASSYFTPGLPGVLSSIGDLTTQILVFTTMMHLSMSLVWLPLVFFVLVTLFSNAVLFTLVIPLTPLILFWAGKIAWILLLLEALVAAPLVALAIVYPDGHEVYGKAEPGIQIMLNLILRPVLMIVGLITGIILTYLIIAISAKGFHVVASQINSFYSISSSEYVGGTLNLLLIFMYGSFIAMAFYKCFSLIYILPDKVLHWIGGTQNERAGAEEMQEMKTSAMQTGQQMAQAGTQTTEKHGQARTEQMHGVQNIGSGAGGLVSAADNYKFHRRNNGSKGSDKNGAGFDKPGQV